MRWSRTSCRSVQLCDGPLGCSPPDAARPAALGIPAEGSARHVESRVQRQVSARASSRSPTLLAAVPAGTPVSVEVPHAALAARLSAQESATDHLRAVRALLNREETRV